MNKFIGIVALVLVAAFSTGCTRISDGEVGVRVGFGGEIKQIELGTGYHQVLVGDVGSVKLNGGHDGSFVVSD
jgi:hypothetical protein